VKPRPDVTSHVFSNGDLSKMFEIANTKEKALLSLSTSLGWEINGVLQLKRKTLQDLINRAKDTGEKFVYFRNIRGKTGVLRLGIINPLALTWCEKWLKLSENVAPMKRRHRRGARPQLISEIFDMTSNGIASCLKRLARKAQIKTVGGVRFHNIRKWVMSGLSRSGFNEWQVKYVLGKAIPMSDGTYLQSLEQEVRERYPEAFENYMNINPIVHPKAISSLSKKLEETKEENQELRNRIEKLEISLIHPRDTSFKMSREEMEELYRQQRRIIEALRKVGLVTTIESLNKQKTRSNT